MTYIAIPYKNVFNLMRAKKHWKPKEDNATMWKAATRRPSKKALPFILFAVQPFRPLIFWMDTANIQETG